MRKFPLSLVSFSISLPLVPGSPITQLSRRILCLSRHLFPSTVWTSVLVASRPPSVLKLINNTSYIITYQTNCVDEWYEYFDQYRGNYQLTDIYIYTVVPVFSGPRDERPPTMYGHFSEVPIDFQRICPLDQRTPTERGRRQFLIIIPLLKRTVIPIWFFLLQNKQHFIVVYDIFKDGVAHCVKTSCTAQCMVGVFLFC